MHENEVSGHVLDAAIDIHRALGPGVLESAYEVALAYVLRSRGLEVARQVPIAVTYRGIDLGEGFRADLIVAGLVIVEIKSVERVLHTHRKQLLTYLRLTRLRLGVLINFGEDRVVDGFERIANGIDDRP
jgi:GxxExxY protein